MNTQKVRNELLSLGKEAALLLEGYVKIYDLKFDRTNFIEIYEAKLKRIETINDEFDSLMRRLEELAKKLEENSIEYDFSYSLGNYICEIIGAMNSYDQRLRCLKQFQINKRYIKGAIVLTRLSVEYKRAERKYLNYGKQLQTLWPQLEFKTKYGNRNKAL